MALPAEFNTVQVYGKYLNLDGTPVVGYLTFEAAPVILKAAVSKDLIVPVVLQVNLTGDGSFSIYLPVTDDPDINPSDWTYKVTEGFGTRRVYNIEVHLASGPTINIYDLAPVSIATGEYYLQGETGPAGPPARITTGKPDNEIGGDGDYAIDLATGVIYHNVTGVWDDGSHLAAADIAAHAALTNTHGIEAGSALVGTTDTQTLTDKTLVAPVVTGGLTADSAHISGSVTVDDDITVSGTATIPAIQGPTTVTGDETISGQLTVQGSTQLAGVTLSGNLDLGTHDASVHNLTASTLISAPRVTVSNNPSATTDAANKNYVDTLAGDTVANPSTLVRRDASSNVAVNQLNIGAGVPTASGHAARKDYVDGKLRHPINAQTANYTLVVADEGKIVQVTNATGTQLTVPTNAAQALPIGSVVQVQQLGAGGITFVPAAGVTINSPGGILALNNQFAIAELQKTATDTWALRFVSGTASVSATASTLVQRDGSGGADAAYLDLPYLATPATPASNFGRMFVDTTTHAFTMITSSGLVKIGSAYWGSGTSYPASAFVQPGDTFTRTDLFCLMEFNGTNWRQTETAEGTAAQRVGIATASLYSGFEFYETDNKYKWRWDGTNWWAISTIRGKMWRTIGGGAAPALNVSTLIDMQASRLSAGFSFASSGLTLPYDGFYEIQGSQYTTNTAAGQVGAWVNRIRAATADFAVSNGGVQYKPTNSLDCMSTWITASVPLKAGDVLKEFWNNYSNSSLAFYGTNETQGCWVQATWIAPLNGTAAY